MMHVNYVHRIQSNLLFEIYMYEFHRNDLQWFQTRYNCTVIKNSEFKNGKRFSIILLPVKLKILVKTLRHVYLENNNSVLKLKGGYFENSDITEYNLSTIWRLKKFKNAN